MQDDRRPIANDPRLAAIRHVLTVNGRSVAVEAAPPPASSTCCATTWR